MLRRVALFLFVAGSMFGQQTLMFLKVEKIDGDVTVEGYEKQIEISGFSYDAEAGAAEASAGAMNRITLTKRFDLSSPSLLKAAVIHTDLQRAILTVLTTSGPAMQTFAVVTLSGEVYVSAVHIENRGTIPPVESIILTFTKAEWCYGPTRRFCEDFSTTFLPRR